MKLQINYVGVNEMVDFENLTTESNNKSSIQIALHGSRDSLVKLRKIVAMFFSESDSHYSTMHVAAYREIMLQAQDAINKENMGFHLIKEIEAEVIRYLDTDRFLIQSNVYLRASRPIENSETENIGWHRETFYGPEMGKSINCWTPVEGVNEDNTLRYIPESQLIPDDNIVVEQEVSGSTERFSAGHKLGFQYSPKKIVSGVDLSNSSKLLVKDGESALFSGNLIHGAAVNKGKSIRFSVDFRLIKKVDYSANNKQHHVTSSKPYFVEYC
jgi:ectoine hydroxylase-related dioxygenase (phytanoyl-CoA dioxygenase family)